MRTCKSCGAEVDWHRRNKYWKCFNVGTNIEHWDTCSKRKFDAIKATGEYFENATEAGYMTPLKASGVQFVMQRAPMRRAVIPLSADCNHCVPPWEVCPNDCPNSR